MTIKYVLRFNVEKLNGPTRKRYSENYEFTRDKGSNRYHRLMGNIKDEGEAKSGDPNGTHNFPINNIRWVLKIHNKKL